VVEGARLHRLSRFGLCFLEEGMGLMDARRRLISIVTVLVAVVCATALGAGSAPAAFTHKYLGSFGSFGDPESLAVDDSTGDVYVYDNTGSGILYKFDSTGAPANFSATGTSTIEGIGTKTFAPDEVQVAVDNSSSVNKGDIYIANGTNVAIYDTTGKSIGELNSGVTIEYPTAYWKEPCGVAVDAVGDVYVGEYAHNIDKYTPSGSTPLTNHDYTSTREVHASEVCNIAVDTHEDFYVPGYFSGPIYEYVPANLGNDAPVVASGVAVAVDLSSDNFLSDEGSSIAIFDSNGTRLEEIAPAAEAPSAFGKSRTIAVNGATGQIFVSDNEHGHVNTFSGLVPVPDTVTGAPSVTTTGATLMGTVNPNGAETNCHFEYGSNDSHFTYTKNDVYPYSVPCTPSPGSGTDPVEVRAEIVNLDPNVVYHYRLVSSSENGGSYGEDRQFGLPQQVTSSDPCPNAAFRTGLSATLPDCRAYEMVSPLDKNGGDVVGKSEIEFVAARSGERVQFASRVGFGDTGGSGYGGTTQYIASRDSGGWSTKGITPMLALGAPTQLGFAFTYNLDFSEELDRSVVFGYDLPNVEGVQPPSRLNHLYLEDTNNRRLLAALSTSPEEGEEVPFSFADQAPQVGGSSADMKVVSFASIRNLVPQATGEKIQKVYAFEDGVTKLAGVLPDGTVPNGGSILAREDSVGTVVSKDAIKYEDTVSRDGSRIFFLSPAEESKQQLYLRKNGSSTVLVSQSEASSPTDAQDVEFQRATPDGTKVLFTSSTRLLDEAPEEGGLYLYTDSPDPEHESNLTYIPNSGAVAKYGQVVKGMSEDGNRFYFSSVSNGNGLLYLWDNGQERQVAPAPGSGRPAFTSPEDAMVTPDGGWIAFMSKSPQTADPLPATFSGSKTEIYVYSEAADELMCASCSQSDTPVMRGVELQVKATAPTLGFETFNQRRFFSSNGRYVFFSSADQLLPQDTNGIMDAYEYNTETGKLSLLSTGEGEDTGWFVEASADGRDAFVLTRQKLNRSDPDKLTDLYDARAGGGLSEPPAPGTPCAGDACQGTPSAAPSFNTASAFDGLGNPVFASPAKTKVSQPTRAQRLRHALAACRKKKSRRERVRCEAAARKRYRAGKPAKHAVRSGR
jgi:hypothetical protein